MKTILFLAVLAAAGYFLWTKVRAPLTATGKAAEHYTQNLQDSEKKAEKAVQSMNAAIHRDEAAARAAEAEAK